MNGNIISELDNTAKELIETLSSFSVSEFKINPSPGKWSAAQMTDHVLQSVSGFYELVSSPGKMTTRAPDKNVENIKATFLDFNIDMKSPEFILPGEKEYERDEIVPLLANKFESFKHLVEEADLSETALNQIPGLEEMTKLEMTWFTIAHAQRHIHQAKMILTQVRTTEQQAVVNS